MTTEILRVKNKTHIYQHSPLHIMLILLLKIKTNNMKKEQEIYFQTLFHIF